MLGIGLTLAKRSGQASVSMLMCGLREGDLVSSVERPRRAMAWTGEKVGSETSVDRILEPYCRTSACSNSLDVSYREGVEEDSELTTRPVQPTSAAEMVLSAITIDNNPNALFNTSIPK